MLVSACASVTVKEQPIRVVGTGSTLEEAKHNGFRKAIEFKIGTMVLSERETNNLTLTKDQLLVYSAGYIDDYKVIDTVVVEGRLNVILDVYVSTSKLSDRTISVQGTQSGFDGTRHDVQYNTYLNERLSGDKILKTILKDYPQRAYKLVQQPYTIRLDTLRNIYITVPYDLTWDYNYLTTLNNAFKITSDNTSKLNNIFNGMLTSKNATVVVISKDPKNLLLGEQNHYDFYDMTRFYLVQNAFYDKREIRLKMTIKDFDFNTIHESCWQPGFFYNNSPKSTFYGTSKNSLVVYGNSVDKGYLELKVEQDSNLYTRLKDIRILELSVLSNEDCKK